MYEKYSLFQKFYIFIKHLKEKNSFEDAIQMDDACIHVCTLIETVLRKLNALEEYNLLYRNSV